MQIFVLLLMIGLLACNQQRIDAPIDSVWLLAIVNLPHAVLALLAAGACAVARRAMQRAPHMASPILRRLERALSIIRNGALVLFYLDMFLLGYLTWLGDHIHWWLLLNDLIAIAPPLGVVMTIWWAYYPIDRRLREASLIRQIDSGEPVWPILSRKQYLINQVRHQLLLMLMPLLVLLAWSQIVARLLEVGYVPETVAPLLLMGGGLCVFLFAPLIIRHLWDTQPMPQGDIRTMLLDLCRRHRVKVRELLLWRTYGGLINGAVMGLAGPLRYILLTDGLLDQLPPREVEAVMAHELGHIRRWHMPWMIVCAMGLLVGVITLFDVVAAGIVWLVPWIPADAASTDATGEWGIVAGALTFAAVLVWAPLFGYISRRFERQADTFAVQHLSQAHADGEAITSAAAHTMAAALASVARLNNVPASRKSWRHGSIQWRIDYLLSLVDTPIRACPIDRQLRLLCWACVAVGLASMAMWWLTEGI